MQLNHNDETKTKCPSEVIRLHGKRSTKDLQTNVFSLHIDATSYFWQQSETMPIKKGCKKIFQNDTVFFRKEK